MRAVLLRFTLPALFFLLMVFSCKSAAPSPPEPVLPVDGAEERTESSASELSAEIEEPPVEIDLLLPEPEPDPEPEPVPPFQVVPPPPSFLQPVDPEPEPEPESVPPQVVPPPPSPFLQLPESEPEPEPEHIPPSQVVPPLPPPFLQLPEPEPEPVPPFQTVPPPPSFLQPPEPEPDPEPEPESEPVTPPRVVPPPPPPFLRPPEPEPPLPPVREEIPLPMEGLPTLPSRPLPESSGEQIVISRIIRVTVRQLVEIPFRGTGWVYLGELGNRRGISYSSRRLDVEGGVTIGQSFIFTTEAPGTYILKFYRQDFIQDLITNDYVQVIVGEEAENSVTPPLNRDRVIAEPRWSAESTPSVPAPIPETDSMVEAEAFPSAPSTPAIESVDMYVHRARQEFDAGRIESALTVLDTMKQHYPLGNDEGWWLYGQLLEANSSLRDIRQALEYYHRLIREYPQSNRVQDAQRRISYLERYYFNIR